MFLLRRAIARPYPPPSHSCGALDVSHAGKRVALAGWLLNERRAKAVSFFNLTDADGTTQLVVDDALRRDVAQIPLESTVLVEGTVALRPQGAQKPGKTGAIDVLVDKVTLLNPASTPLPFYPSDPHNLPNDEVRARYRYLDLRRSLLSDNIKKRSSVVRIVRDHLHQHNFTEVETPVLLRSSPEGAREFLVPTRPSKSGSSSPTFYALQQSPQQPKQLLICSGAVQRYFQIARCFRDEDGRKDRQPEFTQIDLEQAFVSWGPPHLADVPANTATTNVWRIGGCEIRDVIESLVRTIWKAVKGVHLPETFPVITYYEAMTRFGSDKPDTRFGLEVTNITDILAAHRPLSPPPNHVLEAIVVRKSSDPHFIKASRACAPDDSNTEHLGLSKANLRSWLSQSNLASHVLPTLNQNDLSAIHQALALQPGDDIWLSQRPRSPKGGSTPLGQVRLRILAKAQQLGMFPFRPSSPRSNRQLGHYTLTTTPHFLWVTEFPLFTRDDQDKEHLAHGRWSSTHHPFTAPMYQDIDAMYDGQFDKVRGQHYDLVLNGVEIGGGSVRVHDSEMQDYIFSQILQLSDDEKAPFDQLIHALKCGAPPHGGIALGFDRLMAILCDVESIRDVIAFPKSSSGTDLLFKSPAPVDVTVLNQYGISPVR